MTTVSITNMEFWQHEVAFKKYIYIVTCPWRSLVSIQVYWNVPTKINATFLSTTILQYTINCFIKFIIYSFKKKNAWTKL